jgi:hypothetical protein
MDEGSAKAKAARAAVVERQIVRAALLSTFPCPSGALIDRPFGAGGLWPNDKCGQIVL